MTRPRVLMTVPDVAWPLDGGKRLRVESVIRAVAARADADVAVLFADGDPTVRPLPPDVDVRRWAFVPPRRQAAVRTAALLAARRVPWQVAAAPWPEVRAQLHAWRGPWDLVWFGALDHAISLHGIVSADRVVVDCDDVETDKWRGFLASQGRTALPLRERLQRRVELPLWNRLQRHALACADLVLVCSELDRARLLRDSGPGRIAVVPNTYPGPAQVLHPRPQGECTLVVIANYGTDQNVDGATYAATRLLPHLRASVPGARLRLVGRRSERLAHLTRTEGLDIVGAVDDVRAELAGAHAVLVPLRYGGGTRLKVLEAMSHGVPVISTQLGAEGLDAVDGRHLLIADTPEKTTAAVLRLLASPALAERLVRAGRALYDERFRPEATTLAVSSLLDALLSGDQARRPAGITAGRQAGRRDA